MGLVYTDSKETELYNAYGYTVAGKPDQYVWTYDGSGRNEECYSSITITDSRGNTILSRHLGNNAIFKEIFDRNIDNFLWWLKEDNPDTIDIESNFIKVFIQNDQLFSYRIKNRKRRQKEEEDRQQAIAAQMEKIRSYRERLEVYCKDKKYAFCRLSDDDVYIVKINHDKGVAKELLKNTLTYATDKDMRHYIDYAKKYPEEELTILFGGNIEDAVKFISEK